MQYTKGKAGPVSRLTLEISRVHHFDDGLPNSRARGDGIATMKKGVKGVSFLVQGKHHRALRQQLEVGGTIDVTVRWTARDEVTITQTHTVAKAA